MRVENFIVPIIFAALAITARADEKLAVLQAGSEVYSNVTVTSVSATDVYFIYADGMANVKIKDLSPELQKHFNFNPRKAQAAELQLAENKAKYHEEIIRQPAAGSSVDEPVAHEQAPATGKKIWANSFLNQKAPDLIVEKWLTPEPDRRGKFVLIDFWATWCPPCRKAIPELNGYYRKFGDKLVVIGISDESEAAVRRLTDPQIEYSVAIDTQGRTKNVVGVTGIPHVIIIDPQGIVRWEGFPFLEGYELNEKVVADILDTYSK